MQGRKTKARIFAFLLGLVFLGGSLATHSHQTYSSDARQFKAASEIVSVAVAPKIAIAEHIKEFPSAILATFSFAKVNALTLTHTILFSKTPVRKSIKTYIVFKVLRN